MNTKPFKIIFFGTPLFVTPILEELINRGWLVGVVTSPDQKVGRDQKLQASGIALNSPPIVYEPPFEYSPDNKDFPRYHKNVLLKPEKLDETFISQVSQLDPDLIVVAAYGKIIPQSILNIPKYGALNVHPSLLPKYRGGTPIQAAILHGDSFSGITIIQMDDKMDHGPIVYQEEISFLSQDTLESLSNKMFQRASEILVNLIPEYINGQAHLTEQNHEQATFCKLLNKEDGFFDINNPPSPEVLDRMIRAFYPWPNAWTKWNGKIVKFYPNGIVQLEGKKPTRLEDFLRGYPNFPIKTLS